MTKTPTALQQQCDLLQQGRTNALLQQLSTAFERLTFGQQLLQQNQPRWALQWLTLVLQQGPGTAEIEHYAGIAAARCGDLTQARVYLGRVLQRADAPLQSFVALAEIERDVGENARSERVLRQLLQHHPEKTDLWIKSGAFFSQCHDFSRALPFFEQALERAPNAPAVLNDIARCHQFEGRFEVAGEFYRRALEQMPALAGAYIGIATCARYAGTAGEHLLHFLSRQKAATSSEEAHGCFEFAAAKICDDSGRYGPAWQHAVNANRIKSGSAPAWDIAAWHANINKIKALFPRPEYTAGGKDRHRTEPKAPPNGAPIPILVVGMPRSGTTLLERELARFAGVAAAGEQDFFDHLVGATVGPRLGGLYYQGLEQMSAAHHHEGAARPWKLPAAAAELRVHYQQQLCRAAGAAAASADFVIDKNPLNFVHLGVFNQLFPEARMVHCRRACLDVLVSAFFQNFSHPNLGFSYRLETLVDFIQCYEDLMAHWRAVFGPRLVEIDYETLVASPGQTLQQLATCLDLHGALREPDSNQGTVTTASVWQVRQPVYSYACARWHHYREPLGTLELPPRWFMQP